MSEFSPHDPGHDSPGHQHGHQHGHCHGHGLPDDRRRLAGGWLIITGYLLVELLGGHYFHSLALLADAGHMANDSLALLLALLALWLPPRPQRWLALLNGASLLLVALLILVEAWQRWHRPSALLPGPVLLVALVGLLVNGLVAQLLLGADRANLNIRAAYLHVLADLLGSLVAIGAALAAWLGGWYWVDTLASALLSLFILRSGGQITVQAWRQLRA